MSGIPVLMMLASSGIVVLLGLVHLLYTFQSTKLWPRDLALQQAMERISPRITHETTMWRAWIGFNASHAMGALLFGLVYGYLALADPDSLFNSAFLLLLGFAMLTGYLVLGRRYWFSVPFGGIAAATACFAVSVLVSLFFY